MAGMEGRAYKFLDLVFLMMLFVMCVGLGGYSLAMHVRNAGHIGLNVYALEEMIGSLRITPESR